MPRKKPYKKSDSPAISLFAFQDIITSVTGIMLLVVIMLVLEILTPKPQVSSKVEAVVEEVVEEKKALPAEDLAEKELKLARLKAKRQLLEKRLASLKVLVNEKKMAKNDKKVAIPADFCLICSDSEITFFPHKNSKKVIKNRAVIYQPMLKETYQFLSQNYPNYRKIMIFSRPSSSGYIRKIKHFLEANYGKMVVIQPVSEEEVIEL